LSESVSSCPDNDIVMFSRRYREDFEIKELEYNGWLFNGLRRDGGVTKLAELVLSKRIDEARLSEEDYVGAAAGDLGNEVGLD
jgi:hypothetical protein